MDTAISFPIGVVASPTKSSRTGSWAAAHLMRWDGGKLRPCEGWSAFDYGAFASKVRAIHSWLTLTGLKYTAFLCESHCYVDRGDGILFDVSPDVPITPPDSNMEAGGYGDNVYSFGDYGTPRPDREVVGLVPGGYYVDNWGANLVVMTSVDGRLLQLDTSNPANKLTVVAGAPTGNRSFVVTKQRHVMVFDAGGVTGRFAWCSQEDINDWSYADVTKTAGFYDIQPLSPIVTAWRAGDEVCFWTADSTMYVVRYLGVPYVYNYNAIASGVTPVSPQSVARVSNGIIWASSGGFWKYDQSVIDSIPCPVWSWITDDSDAARARFTSAMVPIPTKGEVWWFFPSADATQNDRCAILNYNEGWWSQANIGRTCGFGASYVSRPVMSDGAKVYEHENGNYYGGAEKPWATTFTMNVGSGTLLSTIAPSMPDLEGPTSGLSFRLDYRIQRNDEAPVFNTGDMAVGPDGRVPFRVTGRDFRLTVKQTGDGIGPWTFGDLLLNVIGRGTQ